MSLRKTGLLLVTAALAMGLRSADATEAKLQERYLVIIGGGKEPADADAAFATFERAGRGGLKLAGGIRAS